MPEAGEEAGKHEAKHVAFANKDVPKPSVFTTDVD
jgi:hypothetical protein